MAGENEDLKPKHRLDFLRWLWIAIAVVVALVLLPLMFTGVITSILGGGVIVTVVGVLFILDATLRLKKPQLQKTSKLYTPAYLKMQRGVGIFVLVAGIICLVVSLLVKYD